MVSKNWDEEERQFERERHLSHLMAKHPWASHDRIELSDQLGTKYKGEYSPVLPKQRVNRQISTLIENMSEWERVILDLQEEIPRSRGGIQKLDGYRQMQLDDMLDQFNTSRTELEHIFGVWLDYAGQDPVDENLVPDSEANDENIKNKKAFSHFVKAHLDDCRFKNKFVAFVDGEFQGVGDAENELIEKIYVDFGNVDMYVGRVSNHRKTILIDTYE